MQRIAGPGTRGKGAAATAAVAFAALVGGCGSTTHPTTAPAPTARPVTTTAAAPTSVPSTVPAVGVPSTTVPGTAVATSGPSPCADDQLTVTLGRSDAGLGHAGDALLFRNTGPAACTLGGYPGVALLDAAGKQVVQATRTLTGYLGGLRAGTTTPPVLVVAPGATVSALLEGTDVPTGTATSCPVYARVLVTPPNQTASVALSLSVGPKGLAETMPGCSTPQIHPVVAGTTGQQA
jgi:hypothetical protein